MTFGIKERIRVPCPAARITALVIMTGTKQIDKYHGEQRAIQQAARNSPRSEKNAGLNLDLLRALNLSVPQIQAGAPGFEPGSKVPKTSVLPLHHAPRNCPGNPSGGYCNTPPVQMTILPSECLLTSGVVPRWRAWFQEGLIFGFDKPVIGITNMSGYKSRALILNSLPLITASQTSAIRRSNRQRTNYEKDSSADVCW